MVEQTDALFDSIWNSSLAPIKIKVRARSVEIAKADNRTDVTAGDISEAFREFIPGKPTSEWFLEPQRHGWFNRNVTGFIGITAGLAIVFGVLGLLPFVKETVPEAYAQVAKEFLEIAKIFAGAIVGGAAGAAAASRK